MAIDFESEREVHDVTQAQRAAIDEAMRLILEEDRDRGVSPDERFLCEGCDQRREVLGAVVYDTTRLCNSCATGFELARIRRTATSGREYVRLQAARRQ